MRTLPQFEPHLAIREIRLPKGAEWKPRFRGWCLAHIGSGISYWQEQNDAREVPAGSTLVLSAEARGAVRASQLSEVAITYFCVETGKLSGLLSLGEQHFLKQAAGHKAQAVRVLPPGGPMLALRPCFSASDSSMRLRLVQLFMDLFEWEPGRDSSTPKTWMDGRDRFRKIMNQMAASEFVQLSVSDLAPMMSCSTRHVHRLFRKELGASFREKQIELRLNRACELLAGSGAKVVEVALESGYQSSSVFSELFKRRFGVSPGRWRRQQYSARPAARINL
ncbi:MAG TPA: AraC family transcriptional regulator [Verrucomicrobiae bacterium]|jgi:AraC-like DNA-binding protein